LFLNAANQIYGDKKVIYMGPEYKSISQEHSNKNIIVTVRFDQSNLVFKNTTDARTGCTSKLDNIFQVKTNHRDWFGAVSKITGADTVQVVFAAASDSEQVTNINYAYYPFPECMLYARDTTLPVTPFVAEIPRF
jgi:hypothetical protein